MKTARLLTYGLIAIVMIGFLTLSVVLGSNSGPERCEPFDDDWTVAEVKAMQKVCEQEKLENKEKRSELDSEKQELNRRNDEIRKWYDSLSLTPQEVEEVEKVEEVSDSGMWIHQDKNPLPNVIGNTKQKRFENLINHYARGFDHTVFENAEAQYGVHKELLACIAYAETGIGNKAKSAGNIMNYGNNDRGDTVDFDDVQWNVNAVAHDLIKGTYLGKNTIVGELSQGGRDHLGLPGCAEQGEYCYATSPVNRRGNVNDCLTFIEGKRLHRDNRYISVDKI